jgi:hypothetical protein
MKKSFIFHYPINTFCILYCTDVVILISLFYCLTCSVRRELYHIYFILFLNDVFKSPARSSSLFILFYPKFYINSRLYSIYTHRTADDSVFCFSLVAFLFPSFTSNYFVFVFDFESYAHQAARYY